MGDTVRRRTVAALVVVPVVLFLGVNVFVFGGWNALTPTPCDDTLASYAPQVAFEADRSDGVLTVRHAGGDAIRGGPERGYWWSEPSEVCSATERLELRHERDGNELDRVVWVDAEGSAPDSLPLREGATLTVALGSEGDAETRFDTTLEPGDELRVVFVGGDGTATLDLFRVGNYGSVSR